MSVVGLDLSLTSTGMAALFYLGDAVIKLDRVQTVGRKGDCLTVRNERLCAIQMAVADFVDEANADLVVIENPSYGSRYGSQHDRSGLWWLIVSTIQSWGTPVATVPPLSRAKYATGKGRDDKQAVFDAVVSTYDVPDLADLGWKKGNDMADALVLAAMGSRHLGYPVENDLPAKNLEAMDGAAWPA